MGTTIAYCGLICETCPVYLATLEQDKSRQEALRESIADLCSRQYGMNLRAEDITDCDGCQANDERLFPGCRNCEIRKCAGMKNIENCAYCNDYACEILKNHFILEPDAQTRLEKIRQENQN